MYCIDSMGKTNGGFVELGPCHRMGGNQVNSRALRLIPSALEAAELTEPGFSLVFHLVIVIVW